MYYLYLFMVIDLSNVVYHKPLPLWRKMCLWMYTVCLLLGFLFLPIHKNDSERILTHQYTPRHTEHGARSRV